jgi:hypothetical protein
MYLFPPKVEIIKQKYLNAIDRIFQMKKMWMKNRSNRIYPLIASVHDTFVANLHEVETTPRIVAREKDDQKEAPVVQWWYDWARDISGYARSMMPVRSEATLIWTSYARSWYFKKTQLHMSKIESPNQLTLLKSNQRLNMSHSFNYSTIHLQTHLKIAHGKHIGILIT